VTEQNPFDPALLARALGDVPLFREVQRVLATQRGPVNWETALQVARAVSSTGAVPVAGDHERAAFEGACRIAELGVLHATGLDPSAHLTTVEVLDRTAWAHVTVGELRPLLGRLGARLGGQFGATGLPLPLTMFADALGPFYLGIQFGFFTGCLSWRALGRFDLCLPPARPGRHRLVPQNLALMERDLGVDGRQLQMWLAIREVVHDLTFQSVPWAGPLVKGLVTDYVDAAGVDVPAVLARMQELPPEDLTRVSEHPEDLFTLLATPTQEAIGARLKVAVSVIQGHAEWAMGRVGEGLLPELAKIREGATRRWVERSPVERLFARVLGIDLDPSDLRAGERFVGEVAAAGRLADLWRNVANVPSPDELVKPAAWLERMGE
jgi:putative hydrolase